MLGSLRKSAVGVVFSLLVWLVAVPCLAAADKAAKVYVVLWWDTEDYILPADDDATLRLAEFLSRQPMQGDGR